MTEAIFSGVTSTIMQALVSIDTCIVDHVMYQCKSPPTVTADGHSAPSNEYMGLALGHWKSAGSISGSVFGRRQHP